MGEKYTKPMIGAQLIVWGEKAATELEDVLDEVASLDYAGVEMAPEPLEKYSDPKGLFSARGLALAGLHIGVGDMKKVEVCLELLRRCDAHYLLFSGAGGRGNTEKEYRENSKFMRQAAIKGKDFGVRVCYHNHYQEIINDAMGIKVICSEIEPELVSLCVDTFWVQYGGASPAKFLKANLERVAYLHLKDMKDRDFVELGQGTVDFPATLRAVQGKEVEWAVVEQDTTNRTPRESMQISREYLREKLGL